MLELFNFKVINDNYTIIIIFIYSYTLIISIFKVE